MSHSRTVRRKLFADQAKRLEARRKELEFVQGIRLLATTDPSYQPSPQAAAQLADFERRRKGRPNSRLIWRDGQLVHPTKAP